MVGPIIQTLQPNSRSRPIGWKFLLSLFLAWTSRAYCPGLTIQQGTTFIGLNSNLYTWMAKPFIIWLHFFLQPCFSSSPRRQAGKPSQPTISQQLLSWRELLGHFWRRCGAGHIPVWVSWETTHIPVQLILQSSSFSWTRAAALLE